MQINPIHLFSKRLIRGFLGLLLSNCLAQEPDRFGQRPPDLKIAKAVDHAVAISGESPEAAIAELEKTIQEAPNYYRAQRTLGLALIQQEKNKDAVAILEKAKALKEKENITDPTIYSELGFAQYRSGQLKKATQTFLEGVKTIGNLEPQDQTTLLIRAIAVNLENQSPAAARKLLETAKPHLSPANYQQPHDFLAEGIKKMTANDVEEGWVKIGNLETVESQIVTRPLFVPIDGSADKPGIGSIVTPNLVVNIRARKFEPANLEEPLGRWLGFARVGEKFNILEIETVTSGEFHALWAKIQRLPVPVQPSEPAQPDE